MPSYKILVINPGSTSTKVAVFQDENEILSQNLEHSKEELAQYDTFSDQYELRKDAILGFLENAKIELASINAIAARGGTFGAIKGGAYVIEEKLVEACKAPKTNHESNLAAIIAQSLARDNNIPAWIYDAICVDEMSEIAKISGMPAIERDSRCHVLNTRAVSLDVAKKIGRPYQEVNFIVTHMGGGIATTLHSKGKIIDIVSDDEGTFSPERSGRVPLKKLVKLCYSGKYDERTMERMIKGNGGFAGYLKTNSAQEVEKMMEQGDAKARQIYQAMAYQIAKDIGSLATVVNGDVDCIILTGGIAYSKMMTDMITERIKFLAQVKVVQGSMEMEALAKGALRVLRGEESANVFDGQK